MSKDLLSLKDFDLSLKMNIADRASAFEAFVKQLDDSKHNSYFITSNSNIGSKISITAPYGGGRRDTVSFISNDYLGLSKNNSTIDAGIDALKKYGTGACAAPIIGGYLDLHQELEGQLAEFVGAEDSLVFSSGFGANEGVLRALLGKNDIALIDSFVHSSTLVGLSTTNVKYIGHNDLEYLEKTLKHVEDKYVTKLVIVDGVYSQDGDIADLPNILAICRKYNAFLMVDDAHGIGYYGANGRGVLEHYDLLGKVDLVTGTLSKAFGCVGGFVAGSKSLIQYLRYYAPNSVFSASLTPQASASALKALSIVKNQPELRAKIWSNVKLFRSEMIRLGVDIGNSQSAIFPIKVKDDGIVKDIAAELLQQGFYVIGICFPAVRAKDARIRASILASHTEEEIRSFARAVSEVLNKYKKKDGN